MKISIIIASYNNAATLEQCIKSFLSQSYEQKELVIVDGASKDGSLEVLKKYASQITFISEPDKGIYDALNKGINLVSGQVVGTLGADDFYPNPNILTKVANTFKASNSEAVYGDKQYVNPEDITKVVRYWKAGDYSINNWLEGWMPPHLSFYLKKQNFDKFGVYKPEFTCSGDYELMLRMLYKNKLEATYLPELLVTMRTGGTSTASFSHRLTANKEDRKAWEMNNLKPKWYTLYKKPLSKISQFFK